MTMMLQPIGLPFQREVSSREADQSSRHREPHRGVAIQGGMERALPLWIAASLRSSQ